MCVAGASWLVAWWLGVGLFPILLVLAVLQLWGQHVKGVGGASGPTTMFEKLQNVRWMFPRIVLCIAVMGVVMSVDPFSIANLYPHVLGPWLLYDIFVAFTVAIHLCCFVSVRLASEQLVERSKLAVFSGYYYFWVTVLLCCTGNLAYTLRAVSVSSSARWTSAAPIALHNVVIVSSVILWDVNLIRLQRKISVAFRRASEAQAANSAVVRQGPSTSDVVIRFRSFLVIANVFVLLGIPAVFSLAVRRGSAGAYRYPDPCTDAAPDDYFILHYSAVLAPFVLLWYAWRPLPPLPYPLDMLQRCSWCNGTRCCEPAPLDNNSNSEVRLGYMGPKSSGSASESMYSDSVQV